MVVEVTVRRQRVTLAEGYLLVVYFYCDCVGSGFGLHHSIELKMESVGVSCHMREQ